MVVERNRLKRAAASWVHADIIKAITLKRLEALKWQLKQLQALGFSRKFKCYVLVLVLDGVFRGVGYKWLLLGKQLELTGQISWK